MNIVASNTLQLIALFLSTATNTNAMEMMLGTGFSAEGTVLLDSTLTNNLQIIGAHLHSGSATTNGPVNIIFCGGAPLPGLLAINGECNDLSDQTKEGNKNMAVWEEPTSKGGWDNGANNATAVAGATSLADGAVTTYDSFMDALDACTEDSCDVYFNIHTNFSFVENPGVGLARGQLMPVDCPDGKPDEAKCFGVIGGSATSTNTNMITGLMNPLPDTAGEVTPISGNVLITYVSIDHDDSNIENEEVDISVDDSAAASGYNHYPVSVAILSASTFATWLLQ